MTSKRLRCLTVFFAALLALFAAGQAAAHLIISPMRFVFENKVRSHTLLLMNGDTRPHTYKLGWKLMKMDELGQYHDLPLDGADAHSVPKMVVFSPRQVTLGAEGRQNVRLSLRRPADLPDGEYRGHLLFEEMPDEEPENAKGAAENPSVKIKLALAFTVPVIVRAGDIKPGQVEIGTPKLQNGEAGNGQTLQLDLSHTPGQGSAYGQVVIKSNDEQVGLMSNVAIYPEMTKRILNVPLTRALPSGSSVVVSYEGAGEYKGKTLATKQVTITQ